MGDVDEQSGAAVSDAEDAVVYVSGAGECGRAVEDEALVAACAVSSCDLMYDAGSDKSAAVVCEVAVSYAVSGLA